MPLNWCTCAQTKVEGVPSRNIGVASSDCYRPNADPLDASYPLVRLIICFFLRAGFALLQFLAHAARPASWQDFAAGC